MNKLARVRLAVLAFVLATAMATHVSAASVQAVAGNSNVLFSNAPIGLGTGNTGIQVIEFNVTPSNNDIDGVIGYAGSVTNIAAYSSMGLIVRMNPAGTFDARNGGVYGAITPVPYTAHTTYHIKIVARLSQANFDVWVNPLGAGQPVQIASGYSFRSDAPALSDIGKVDLVTADSRGFTVTDHFVSPLPTQASVLGAMKLVNDHWQNTYPVGNDNSWNSGVYHMGNVDCYLATLNAPYLAYSTTLASNLQWRLNGGATTTSADQQCIGNTFLSISSSPEETTNTAANLDAMVTPSTDCKYWWWIDAIHMAMPIFARQGVNSGDVGYFNTMHKCYVYPKSTLGLYDTSSYLWYRDPAYIFPGKPNSAARNSMNTTPAGLPVFWSRGNGWVFDALARVMTDLPQTDSDYSEYRSDFCAMAAALAARQRSDGFWNPNLADPNDHGQRETSGTAAFVYGMAWGVNNGILDAATYLPVISKAWDALTTVAVQSDGTLGYVQGPGSNPNTQQLWPNSTTDFGVGLFLSAGSQVVKLSPDYTIPGRLLTGSLIDDGAGPWNGTSSKAWKAFDGNPNTFYDCANPIGWTGVDLGAGVTATVTAIKFWPRTGYASRMVGGKFQGSNDGSTWTLFKAIDTPPTESQWTIVTPMNAAQYRYMRYLGPANGYGNIADMQFYGG